MEVCGCCRIDDVVPGWYTGVELQKATRTRSAMLVRARILEVFDVLFKVL